MNLFNIPVIDVNHQKTDLSQYRGKVLLIINTATKCGYTKQYQGLQVLYDKYHDKGFEILDFPSNQFMGQAPGKTEEIKAFCDLNFGTTFPIFEKIKVNGFFAHPLYKYLKANVPKEINPGQVDTEVTYKKSQRIKWNFTKFLINKEGQIIHRFSPKFTPEEIDGFINELLS